MRLSFLLLSLTSPWELKTLSELGRRKAECDLVNLGQTLQTWARACKGTWSLGLLYSKSPVNVKSVSRWVVSNSLQPHGLQPAKFLCPWNSPGKNTGVGCHFLLQGIFPTQGSNQILLGRWILYHWVTWEDQNQLYFNKNKYGLWFSLWVVSNFFDPMDFSLPGSSVHGIFQATILEWVAISFSRESSQGLNLDLLHCRQILYHLSHQCSQ